MKKLSLFVLFLIILGIFVPFVNAATFESQTIYQSNGNRIAWNIVNWEAMTFTALSTHDISAVAIKAYRLGLPGATTISIRNVDSNEKPTGTDLATGSLDVDVLTTDNQGEWVSIQLTKFRIKQGVKYAIVIAAPPGSSLTEYLKFKCKNTDVYSGGNVWYSANSGSTWSASAPVDSAFIIYGPESTSTIMQTAAVVGSAALIFIAIVGIFSAINGRFDAFITMLPVIAVVIIIVMIANFLAWVGF